MPLTKPNPALAASATFIGPLSKPILKPSPAVTPASTPRRAASPSPDSRTYDSSSSSSSSSSSHGPSAKHAHFPPPGQEPTARYSGVDYDRTPIIVLPNTCALPARGCPGKTYFQDEERGGRTRLSTSPPSSTAATPLSSGNHAHPAKLVKKHAHRPSAGGVHHALSVSSDTTTTDGGYSSDDDPDTAYHRVAVVFPPSTDTASPTTMFSTERVERDRKTSNSSARTVTVAVAVTASSGSSPAGASTISGSSPRRRKGSVGSERTVTGLTAGTGRSAWSSSTSESSEDDCLGGF